MAARIITPGLCQVWFGRGRAVYAGHFASRGTSHRVDFVSDIYGAAPRAGLCLLGAGRDPWRPTGWITCVSAKSQNPASDTGSDCCQISVAGAAWVHAPAGQRRKYAWAAAQQPAMFSALSRGWHAHRARRTCVWPGARPGGRADTCARQLLGVGSGFFGLARFRAANRCRFGTVGSKYAILARYDHRTGLRDARCRDKRHTVRAIRGATRSGFVACFGGRRGFACGARTVGQPITGIGSAKADDCAGLPGTGGAIAAGQRRLAAIFTRRPRRAARPLFTRSGLAPQGGGRAGHLPRTHRTGSCRQSSPNAADDKRIRGQ